MSDFRMTMDSQTLFKLCFPVALLLGVGAVQHWCNAARDDRALAYRPLPLPLSEIPNSLGPFTAQGDLELEPWVVEVTHVNKWVRRKYADPSSEALMELYVGYWGRVNVGMDHGPEVCFPRSGWSEAGPVRTQTLAAQGPLGAPQEALLVIHHFTRAQPEGIENVAVGFVAVVDGEFCASTLGTFVHRIPSGPNSGFMAQVELVTPVRDRSWDEADRQIMTMMKALLPHVSRCLFGPGVEASSSEAVLPARKGT